MNRNKISRVSRVQSKLTHLTVQLSWMLFDSSPAVSFFVQVTSEDRTELNTKLKNVDEESKVSGTGKCCKSGVTLTH